MASGRLRLHAAVGLLATVVVGCGYLQGSAYIGNGLSLVEQLHGTAQLVDDLLGIVAFAFHGASHGQVWPEGKLSQGLIQPLRSTLISLKFNFRCK
jgi:hypothetical protein